VRRMKIIRRLDGDFVVVVDMEIFLERWGNFGVSGPPFWVGVLTMQEGIVHLTVS